MLEQNLKVSQGREKKRRSSTMQILSCVAIGVSLFCTQSLTQAQGVYKWTDAAGKVHYGDRQSAPQKSVKVADNAPKSEAANDKQVDGKGSQSAGGDSAQDELKPFRGIPIDRLKKCMGFANEIASKYLGNSSEDRMDSITILQNKIRLTCSFTGFDCTIDSYHPERNQCVPFVWKGTGTLVSGNVDGTKFKTGTGVLE